MPSLKSSKSSSSSSPSSSWFKKHFSCFHRELSDLSSSVKSSSNKNNNINNNRSGSSNSSCSKNIKNVKNQKQKINDNENHKIKNLNKNKKFNFKKKYNKKSKCYNYCDNNFDINENDNDNNSIKIINDDADKDDGIENVGNDGSDIVTSNSSDTVNRNTRSIGFWQKQQQMTKNDIKNNFASVGFVRNHETNNQSNGRIHSAVVSKINPNLKSVTVEWYEKGETKGKEVELDAIMQLNANLFQEQHAAPEPKKQAINISRNPTQGAIRVMNKINAQNGHRTSRITLNCVGQSDHVENIPPQQPQPPQPPPSQLTGLSKSRSTHNATKMSQSGIVTSSSGGVGPRRSYVVKEVERLKENREKRRARQAELKEEKHALMNLDPGNPNWETSAMIREYQSTIEFRPLIDGQAIEDHQITVCVRKRPLSRKEVMRKEIDVISVPSKDQLIVHEPRNKVDLTKFLENHRFRFDYAFDDNCNNEIVYKYTAKPLVQTIFDGGMATCFAYGQTGSGKTHTMGGEFNGKVQDCKNGIYAMAAKDVFTYLNGPRYNHLNLVVSASFFEIYSGKVFDLLADKQKLRVLEDAKQQVQVVGLTEKVVDSVEDVLKLIQHGNSARTSGQTSANSNSSRSHAVFQIVLRPPGSNKIHGKFSFIDLAGNERGADTSSANRQTRMEGAEINKSLLALKECIRALGKQSAHLPFRVSKLTQVLRDSFIGEKSKTCMIAMISPGLSSCEHTLNTLRYADRVKELVVKDLNEMRNDDIEQMESDDHKNGQLNENELAHLRSISEHDMSDELFNQHAVISDLQQTEELVVDQHKAINEFLARFLPESRELYNLTNYVDYDQDAYCKRGEELFTQLADFASSCREAMSEFRSKLTKEEMLSHAIKPGKR